MATDWSSPSNFAPGSHLAWKSKITSVSSAVDFKHVSEAPENLMLAPEDFEIVPEEVQSDKEDWAITYIDPNDGNNWTVVSGEND